MQGWLFTGTHIAPKLITKPDPKAAAGEVVLDVKAAGLCHSDVGALEDPTWMPFFKAPVIFGHECAGVVTEVGDGVTEFKLGDRVGVCPINTQTNITIGYGRDGGYATKVAVPACQLIPLPDEVTFVQGGGGNRCRHDLLSCPVY